MKTPSEQKSIITLDGIAEVPWQIWENAGREHGRDQDRLLRAEQHEIAEAAWQIWEHEGRQDGRALEYWLSAEQQLLTARQQKSGRTNAAAANGKNSPARVKNSLRAPAALARPNATVSEPSA